MRLDERVSDAQWSPGRQAETAVKAVYSPPYDPSSLVVKYIFCIVARPGGSR